MSIFTLAFIIIINCILQSTIIPYFAIFEIVPNISLIIVVLVAILKGKKVGSITGLIVGMLQDIMFGIPIGINSFIYFFVGYLIGMTENKLSKESTLLPIIMSILSTVGYHLLFYVFMFFLNYNVSLSNFLKDVVFIETTYNSLISLFLFKLSSRYFGTSSMRFGKR